MAGENHTTKIARFREFVVSVASSHRAKNAEHLIVCRKLYSVSIYLYMIVGRSRVLSGHCFHVNDSNI